MIDDYAHAARLQARHEGDRHWCDLPTSPQFLTLAALAGLLKHFTGSDDGISDELVQAARDCVGEETRADGGSDVRDLIAAWDYSAIPEAAATYLITLLAPSQPVNRGLLGKTAGQVMECVS
jgi:hypothetical protein